MILLERKKPHQFEVLEALNRRLPKTDEDYEYYISKYNRIKKGYQGELRVDNAWSEIIKSNKYCLLHSFEIINDVGKTHQIDTLFICPHFMLVVEIKNISGRLDFDEPKHQFTQTLEDGMVYGYSNPIDQVKRHVRYLWSFDFQLPIEYAIVISNPSTFIGAVPRNEPIFHVSGLYDYVHFLYKKHAEFCISKEKVVNIGTYLKGLHSPKKWAFEINLERLRKGVFCEKCRYRYEMDYYRRYWRCKKCLNLSNEVLIQGINDYRLLIGNKITSRQFREFFNIESNFVAARLLTTLGLEYEGKNKGRVYTIP